MSSRTWKSIKSKFLYRAGYPSRLFPPKRFGWGWVWIGPYIIGNAPRWDIDDF